MAKCNQLTHLPFEMLTLKYVNTFTFGSCVNTSVGILVVLGSSCVTWWLCETRQVLVVVLSAEQFVMPCLVIYIRNKIISKIIPAFVDVRLKQFYLSAWKLA